MSQIKRCTCASERSRVNGDGSRDFKVTGKASCARCMGLGGTVHCEACDGCGLLVGERCGKCHGNGVTPARIPIWTQQPRNAGKRRTEAVA